MGSVVGGDEQHSWINAELTSALPNICQSGEGQSLEFKEKLPPQAHDMGKSMAAFASSGSGRILYGVSDDGKIVGLPDAMTTEGRDKINQRICGAAKDVKPPVHPSISWAMHEGCVVCVVSIDKGFDAIYYSNYKPIIRRGATSRPAEPGEVEKAFRERYASETVGVTLPSTLEIASRMKSVLARMNEQRRHDPFSVADLARSMGLGSPAELDGVMSGRDEPSFALIDKFCDRLAVDKEWVVAGRGAPFVSLIEHQILPEHYLAPIDEAAPEMVFAVRSKSHIGEAFIVVYCDDFKVWCVPDVWHASDHVGGRGSRDLVSLYRLFKVWIESNKPYMVLGRLIEPELASALINGEVHPGVVEALPLSHWWDDLTDLEHSWTTRTGLEKAYGRRFVAAQDIIRKKLGDELA